MSSKTEFFRRELLEASGVGQNGNLHQASLGWRIPGGYNQTQSVSQCQLCHTPVNSAVAIKRGFGKDELTLFIGSTCLQKLYNLQATGQLLPVSIVRRNMSQATAIVRNAGGGRRGIDAVSYWLEDQRQRGVVLPPLVDQELTHLLLTKHACTIAGARALVDYYRSTRLFPIRDLMEDDFEWWKYRDLVNFHGFRHATQSGWEELKRTLDRELAIRERVRSTRTKLKSLFSLAARGGDVIAEMFRLQLGRYFGRKLYAKFLLPTHFWPFWSSIPGFSKMIQPEELSRVAKLYNLRGSVTWHNEERRFALVFTKEVRKDFGEQYVARAGNTLFIIDHWDENGYSYHFDPVPGKIYICKATKNIKADEIYAVRHDPDYMTFYKRVRNSIAQMKADFDKDVHLEQIEKEFKLLHSMVFCDKARAIMRNRRS